MVNSPNTKPEPVSRPPVTLAPAVRKPLLRTTPAVLVKKPSTNPGLLNMPAFDTVPCQKPLLTTVPELETRLPCQTPLLAIAPEFETRLPCQMPLLATVPEFEPR